MSQMTVLIGEEMSRGIQTIGAGLDRTHPQTGTQKSCQILSLDLAKPGGCFRPRVRASISHELLHPPGQSTKHLLQTSSPTVRSSLGTQPTDLALIDHVHVDNADLSADTPRQRSRPRT